MPDDQQVTDLVPMGLADDDAAIGNDDDTTLTVWDQRYDPWSA